MKTIALRIDVDTYRGTGRGVPALCRILAARGVKGTFYFPWGRTIWAAICGGC